MPDAKTQSRNEMFFACVLFVGEECIMNKYLNYWGVILVALYCLGWIVFWKEDSIRKSLYLSIIPSLLFIESGIISGNILLLIFAVIFAPCHILISYMNVILI